MKKILKIEKNNLLNFMIWMFIIVIFLINNNIFIKKSNLIIFSFLLFELMISFIPKEIRKSLPIIIIQVTGIIRYIIIPLLIQNEEDYSNKITEIMIYELLSIYLGIIIYTKCEKKNNRNKLEKYENTSNNQISQKIGISAIITIIIGGIYVIINRNYLERYFSFTNSKSIISEAVGGISLLISVFFLILFIKSLEFIYKIEVRDFIKIILSLLISVFYINGSSITGNNVSRWSMIISAIISYIYISRLYPNYKNKMKILLIICIVFSISIGSLMKFENSNNGYDNIKDVFKKQMQYKTLNSYFAGNKNMEIGLELSHDISIRNISKIEIIFSDIFANFPILNKIFSNPENQTVNLFNYKYYNSMIAKDQIIPYSAQIYIYFKYIFILFEIIQIYYALKIYNKIEKEKDLLMIHNYVYLFFSLSLVNCINLSIILQNIWIHVLPVYIIYLLNIKVKQKK